MSATKTPAKVPRQERQIAELARLADDAARKKFLAGHRRLVRKSVVENLCEQARKTWRVDTKRALELAGAALAIAERLKDRGALAQSWRTLANALYFCGQNRAAIEAHDKALRLFERLKDEAELARTLSASIQPLILVGEYDRAHQAAERARAIFTRDKNDRRLANLDINLGNILHRQDRFQDALACYGRAYEAYHRFHDVEGMAVALHNSAVSLICLNDFPQALATYQHSRELAERNGMPLLVAQADYNIAYLYFFRGEYSRAIEMLREVRQRCSEVGDYYHLALTYLDQSEIYLELNLSAEAEEMAAEALVQFQKLGMGYEAAKALAFQAIALGQQGKNFAATELFEKARAMFVQEQNQVWPWLLDLYRAVILSNEGRLFEARRLCAEALEFFRASAMRGKAVLCELLLAQLALRTGDAAGAQAQCREVLVRLARLELPALSFQAYYLMGQIEEAGGQAGGAYQAYQAARLALENLRSSLRGDELKIAFMKNKLEVYEALVDLCVRRESDDTAQEAFEYMELAKSRSLMDLMFSGAHALPVHDAGQSELVRKIRHLREELNWYYHRIEQENLKNEDLSAGRIEKLQQQARAHESDLLRALHDLPASETRAGHMRPTASVAPEALRAALPAGAALVEYFAVRGRFMAALVTKDALRMVPLTPVSRVKSMLRMLEFQLAKFRLRGDYVTTFQKPLLEATQSHLRDLYEELLAPLRQWWKGEHLVVVPHGILHYLPFHALYDGNKYLIDECRVTYAPSATVYELCHRKAARAGGGSLVLGVPDPQAPFILEEVQAVASNVPAPELFVGERATAEVLREKGAHSSLIHIAAHGTFREDNPMFSRIRLGQSYLSLYDLYNLDLPAELVTLSGCATGVNVVAAGDELLGLVRGLFSAGAQSLLLTLWDVNDKSTAEFMRLFYGRLRDSGDKAGAVRDAMLELRSKYPHPYYWAPFLLIGKAFQATQ